MPQSATPDAPYHFPPELMELLIETIPLLFRSKVAVLAFFRGCGVQDSITADLQRRVEIDRTAINKYEIARTVLNRLNDRGDQTLAQRREVVKRVTEFEDFSACWDTDQLKAQGLVSRVRSVVNVKDSFTRLSQEYERDRLERRRQQEVQTQAIRRQREERDSLHRRLLDLRSMSDPRQRGLALEGVLNDIFKLDDLSVREAFALSADSGETGEQIDGLVVMGSHPVLIEAKWHARPLGTDGVSRHMTRVLLREPGVHGLIVSASGFTTPAIEECTRALALRAVMLAELNELVMLLEDPTASVRSWLEAKLLAAQVDRKVFFRPGIEAVAG